VGEEKDVIKELKKITHYNLDIEKMMISTLKTQRYKKRNFDVYNFNPETHLRTYRKAIL